MMVNELLCFIAELCCNFPNLTVIISPSNEKKRSNVFKKLETYIYVRRYEDLEDIRKCRDECSIRFNNGSIITIISLSERSRGRRANVILYDKSMSDTLVDYIVYPMMCHYHSDKNETIMCNGTILRVDFNEYNK